MPVAISNGLALPNPLSNGTTGDAVPVMADFNYLLSALNRALLDTGGGAGMNAQSVQLHNLANGTSANDAVNLSQLTGFAALAGAAFTGGVTGTSLGLSGTLNVSGNATFTGASFANDLNLSTASLLLNVNNRRIQFTDLSGSNPFLVCQSDNNFVFWGTDATGAARSIWSIFMRNSASIFNINPPVSLVSTLTVAGLLTASSLISGSSGLSISGSLILTGPLTTGTGANAVGYLGTPQALHVGNYTLALSDSGTDQAFNGVGLTATIPANASVAFPIGAILIVTNLNASPLTIAITTDTLTISGTTTSGPRTLGQNGEARLRKVSATSWLIAGTALS